MKRGSRREQKNCCALGSTQPGVLPWAWELAAIAELGLSAHWKVKDIGTVGHTEQQSQERIFCITCLLLTCEGPCELITAPLPGSSVMFSLSLERSSGTEMLSIFFSWMRELCQGNGIAACSSALWMWKPWLCQTSSQVVSWVPGVNELALASVLSVQGAFCQNC